MIYVSILGNHDKITPGNPFGATLTIFLQYKDKIENVFLFVTPSKRGSEINYQQIAEQTKGIMLEEKPDVKVELVNLPLDNPVDFDLVYPVMLDATQKILENEALRTAKKIINITSGTPTMTACWVLLHKSGLIPNSIIVQSFETKYAQQRGKSTQEVNLEIDDFPQIIAPSALKRQLTIVHREKEQLAKKVQLVDLDEKVPELIGHSQAIRQIKEQILYDIDEHTHVLITGDRGTGKEVVAHAIWRLYHRENDDKLTVFDCGAFPKELIISELFGYKKGAFTGATDDNPGILSLSDGKMLFLDEIGNLPMEGQFALLRYLQTGEIRRIGEQKVLRVETQIIAATNKNINDPTLFAQDLKDRFDDIIELPALKERKEDIPSLIQTFLNRYAKRPIVFKNDLIEHLVQYDWPGNVRELEKWIQKIVRRFPEGGVLSLKDLPERFIVDVVQEEEIIELPELPLAVPLEEYIEMIREKAQQQAGGNMAQVDRLLKQKVGTEKQRQWRRKKKGNDGNY